MSEGLMLVTVRTFLLLCAVTLASARASRAQVSTLDSLIATSLRQHPGIRAALARVDAASAAVRPAAAMPDPMLMAGVENLPLGKEQTETPSGHGQPAVIDDGLPDMMTMKMLGISQTLPFPGKLRARRRAAEQQLAVAEARLEATRRQIAQDVAMAYYELVYRHRALQIVRASEEASQNAERAAEARYIAGLGEQSAVLDARVATVRFAEQRIALEQEQSAARAALEAALAGDPPAVLDASAAKQDLLLSVDHPVRLLNELHALALQSNPELLARRAEIAALGSELDVTRREYLPDFDVSFRYGQRTGRPDMISASVAVPLPIQKRSKQDEITRGAQARLIAAESELEAEANRLRANVAALRADLDRIRQQASLFQRSILPQARAALESATAGLTTGKVELFSVIQRRTELLDYELALERLLVDFGQKVAQLENVVGTEVHP